MSSLQGDKDDALARIEPKLPGNIRLVTFNINGFRTLFHYHPWNKLRTLRSMFDSLKTDIISLQELKVTSKDISHSLGRVDGYHTFLTVPSLKKGYSGVSVHVRIPKNDEPESVKNSLKVVRAEEGITGVLISHDTKKPYIESENNIGGYVDQLDYDLARKVDSEGRCIIIELATNVVIISTYCPANSMGTDDGQEFRVDFFKALFARIRNLEAAGKQVILMGDINISRDLIDSAESLDEMGKAGLLKEANEATFEKVNHEEAISFIRASVPKTLLNNLLIDSIDTNSPTDEKRILVDTVRKIHGRKRALYTVWNTIRNSRPGNFGARIDLILATESLASLCKDANIWPYLMGSDHCPVFSDFDVSSLTTVSSNSVSKLPKLEAKYVYRLSNSDISTMFSMSKKRTALSSSSESASPSPSSQEGEQSRKITKRSEPSSSKPSPALKSGGGLKTTKSQNKNSIANFFKANKKTTPELVEHEEKPIPFELLDDSKPIHNPEGSKITISNGRFKIGSETIPKCKHNEPCVLKTSRKPTTKGKKFWSCGRPPGDPSTNDKYDCGFFQWK